MNIGEEDNVYTRIKNEIIKKQVLLKEEKKDIETRSKENKFLENVLQDYNRYNNYIKEQKKQQYFALLKISQHLDKLMEESYISKTKIEKLRFDKNKTLKEINIVRLELDQISENKI